MKKILENEGLIKKLLNCKIFQVSFSLNTIVFSFDEGYIQFSGGFEFRSNGKIFTFEEVYPLKDDNGLISVLENEISRVAIDQSSLLLVFSSNSELVLFANEQYESFEIVFGAERVVF